MTNSEKVSRFRRNRKQLLVNLMGGQCSICGYNKCIAALDFHHINPATKKYGIAQKGTCHNLEDDIAEVKKCSLVCANCHREVELLGLNTYNTFDEEKYQLYLEEIQPKKHTCSVCGVEISKGADKCRPCFDLSNRTCERPDREALKSYIRAMPFTAIGKMFGVSDNAIRKWCDNYNLPRKSTDIKKYTDDEWNNI